MTDAAHTITTLPQLQALFGDVSEIARRKEKDFIHPAYRVMIEQSPFVVLATVSPDGLDVSPRGDPPGFVEVKDKHTLLLPERPGNNRIDSLRNLIIDPRVSLLFLIPGVGETLRVNGRALITVAPELLQRFSINKKLPKCVLEITVERIYFQCSKALHRSHLWQAGQQQRTLPSTGALIAALTEGDVDAEQYDHELPARIAKTLY